VIVIVRGVVVGPVYTDEYSSEEVRTMVHRGVSFASILFVD
jgi:hypothetical protein